MATYTLAYKSVCAGGGHYTFNIKRDTTVIRTITIGPEALADKSVDAVDIAMFLIRLALNQANPTTMAQARTAIEAIQVTV